MPHFYKRFSESWIPICSNCAIHSIKFWVWSSWYINYGYDYKRLKGSFKAVIKALWFSDYLCFRPRNLNLEFFLLSFKCSPVQSEAIIPPHSPHGPLSVSQFYWSNIWFLKALPSTGTLLQATPVGIWVAVSPLYFIAHQYVFFSSEWGHYCYKSQ